MLIRQNEIKYTIPFSGMYHQPMAAANSIRTSDADSCMGELCAYWRLAFTFI